MAIWSEVGDGALLSLCYCAMLLGTPPYQSWLVSLEVNLEMNSEVRLFEPSGELDTIQGWKALMDV